MIVNQISGAKRFMLDLHNYTSSFHCILKVTSHSAFNREYYNLRDLREMFTLPLNCTAIIRWPSKLWIEENTSSHNLLLYDEELCGPLGRKVSCTFRSLNATAIVLYSYNSTVFFIIEHWKGPSYLPSLSIIPMNAE